MEEIEIGFSRGHCVAVHRGTGTRSSVHLPTLARRMARRGQVVASGDVIGALSELDDSPEIGSLRSRWRKLKRRVKKAVKKVASVAARIAKSKIGKAILGTLSVVTPPPFGAAIAATAVALKFAGKLSSDPQKKKALPALQGLALGTMAPKKALAVAARYGIGPNTAKQIAVGIKMKAAAAHDPKAAAVVRSVELVQRAVQGNRSAAYQAVRMAAEAKLRQQFPNARVLSVTAPSGRPFLSAVVPLS